MCKLKYAASVIIIMPLTYCFRSSFSSLSIIYIDILFKHKVAIRLDKRSNCGIFIITNNKRKVLRERYVITIRHKTLESRFSHRRRHSQCVTRESKRPQISRKRVFRPPRHRPGEVRNVAPRTSGKCNGDGCRRRIRLLQTSLLSGSRKLRQGRHCRTGAQETRTSRPPQNPSRYIDFSRTTGYPRPTYPRAQTGEAGSAGVWARHTSKDDRTSPEWKKNAEVKTDSLERKKLVLPYSEPEQAASRYEALRMSAFGEPIPVEYRRGLALFLRRGMLSWLRSLTTDNVSQMRSHALPTAIRAPYQKSAVIRIFAAMTATQA
jgi:hypothetical protein